MINSGDCFKCPFKHRPQSPMTHFSIVSWSLTRKGCFISFLDSFPPSWMLGPPASLESVVESWRSTPFWDVWNRFFRFSREKKAPTTNSRVRTPEKKNGGSICSSWNICSSYERALCRMISLTRWLAHQLTHLFFSNLVTHPYATQVLACPKPLMTQLFLLM